jgi:hypothetical protein
MFCEMTVFTMFTDRVNCKTSSQRGKMDASIGVAEAVFSITPHSSRQFAFCLSLSLSLSLAVSLSLSLSLSHTHTHTHTHRYTEFRAQNNAR